jgi:hypothetical protein
MASTEIHSVQTVSGNQARIRRIIEEAGQTFLPGTPVQIAAGDGGVKAWDGVTIARGIAGFSKEFGNNLAALGVIPTAAVNPTPQPSTGQAVPFQPSAVSISRPLFRDGRQGFEVAVEDTVFLGQVGPAQTALATDVGVQYGLTIDADNHWFVDKTKSTVGTNTVLTIVKLDPNDQSATPRGVYFVITTGAQQLIA